MRGTVLRIVKNIEQLYEFSTPCIDDHQLKMEELESVGELPDVCSRIFLLCMYLSRIDRSAFLWSVNKLARAVMKWTRACDRRLARLTSCIRYTSTTACSLRASFVERAGVQMDASLDATQIMPLVFFLVCSPCLRHVC